jgi:hypothetical protein
MFDELGKFGVTVKEIGPDQVRSIKGTAAVAALNSGSGVVLTAERPGIVVFLQMPMSKSATFREPVWRQKC